MKKYFMFFAACLMAAFVLTSCGEETEQIPDSLVKTTFVSAKSVSGIKTTVSFVDEKNAIIKMEIPKTLFNGKEIVVEDVAHATYVAANGAGELHIDKTKFVMGEAVTPLDADMKLPIVYNLKSKTMTYNEVQMVMTDYEAMEWKDAPLAGAGALPTEEELKGAWYGMTTVDGQYASVCLEVREDGIASVQIMNSSSQIDGYEGTYRYADGKLSFGVFALEMTPMVNDRYITDVKMYMNGELFRNILALMKD